MSCVDHDDALHCDHWFAGERCCRCADDNSGHEPHPDGTTRAWCPGPEDTPA